MAFDPSKVNLIPVEELPEEAGKEKATPKKKKGKLKYSKGRYAKIPVSKSINKGITNAVNTTILKKKVKKLRKDDCEVGEAVMYMVEYYAGIDVEHPALVMMGAVMGLAFTVAELAGEEPTKIKDEVEPRPEELIP